VSNKEKALFISTKLQEVQRQITTIESDLYYTDGNRDRLRILKRVRRALSHDLDQLVNTIPAPVQFNFFDLLVSDTTPEPASTNDPLNESADGR